MKRYVKIIVLSAAAAAVLTALAAVNGIRASRYSQELRNNYVRALVGLTESVCAIDIELHKCICAGTQAGFAENAAQVWADSQRGKVHLSELPAADGELDSIERFLAQAGDYVISVSERAEPTDEQYDRLVELSEYAAVLRIALEDVLSNMDDSRMLERELQRLGQRTGQLSEKSSDTQSDGLSSAGEALKDYPAMIYDGPYSDHIYERTPAYIEKKTEVSQQQALDAATEFIGTNLRFSGESDNAIGEYIFETDDESSEIAVSKRGGVVSYMLRDVRIGEQILSVDQARESAENFLRRIEMDDLVSVQHNVYAGICVFSYAPQQDNIVLYPDQIKVSVALDCGDVVAYDARDYIMNHAERGVLTAAKTRAQAEKCISDMLTVTDSRMVLIQADGIKEYVCYEFFCRRWDGGEAAVYINADTLREEQIFLLSRTDDCFLAV